jgi:hypothetical protein
MNPEKSRVTSKRDTGTPLDSPIGLDNDGDDIGQGQEQNRESRALPDDLPKSLDDRRSGPIYVGETEMYDGWQGM